MRRWIDVNSKILPIKCCLGVAEGCFCASNMEPNLRIDVSARREANGNHAGLKRLEAVCARLANDYWNSHVSWTTSRLSSAASTYNHCGVAASEKCLSVATFVRWRGVHRFPLHVLSACCGPTLPQFPSAVITVLCSLVRGVRVEIRDLAAKRDCLCLNPSARL